jgi:hypothetical protein
MKNALVMADFFTWAAKAALTGEKFDSIIADPDYDRPAEWWGQFYAACAPLLKETGYLLHLYPGDPERRGLPADPTLEGLPDGLHFLSALPLDFLYPAGNVASRLLFALSTSDLADKDILAGIEKDWEIDGENISFPLALLEELIVRTCPPGGKILEPCAGRAPVSMKAALLGVGFVAVENHALRVMKALANLRAACPWVQYIAAP